MRWFAVCLLLLSWFLPSPVGAASTLTITAPQANVRAGPRLTSQVLTAVPQGAIFPVVASQSGWHQIRLEDGREGFLLPYDANPRNLFTTALSMSDVRRIGQRFAAKHILFAVDACYSGFAVAQARSPQRVDTNYLRLILQDPAVQVITAGKSGESDRIRTPERA